MATTLHQEKPRKNGESLADFYYRLEGGHLAETQSDHLRAMWGALDRCVKSGEAEYWNIDNGSGTVHMYKFHKGEAPTFNTNSQDVFNQIEIVEL